MDIEAAYDSTDSDDSSSSSSDDSNCFSSSSYSHSELDSALYILDVVMEVGPTTAAQQQWKRKPKQLSKTKLSHLHLMAVLPPLHKKLLLFLTKLVEAREVVDLPDVVVAPGEVIPPKGLGRILLRGLHKTLEALEEETGEEVEEEKEVEKDVEDENYNCFNLFIAFSL